MSRVGASQVFIEPTIERGGYLNTKDMLCEFVMLTCCSCNTVGRMTGTTQVIPKDKGVNEMFLTKPPVIFYKETEGGVRYDPLCGPCSTKVDLIEVEAKPKS